MLKLVRDLGFGTESIARTRADSTDDSLWQNEASPLHAAGRLLTDLITAKQVGGAGTIHIKLLDSSDGGLFGTAYLESNAASDITQVTIRITSSKYQLKIRAGPLDPRCCCLLSPGPPKMPSDCVWQSPPPPPPPDGKRPGPVWHEILVEPGDLNYTEGVLYLFVFTMGIPARFRVDVDLATPHKREGPSAVERRKQAAKEFRDITAVIRERDARIKLLNGGLRHSSKPSFPPQAIPTPTLSLARSASPAWSPTNNRAANSEQDQEQQQQQQQQQPAHRRPASAPTGGRHPTDRLLVYRRDPSPQGMQRLGLRRTPRPGSAEDGASSPAVATAAAARMASSLLGQKRISTWVGESGAVGRTPRPASAMEARRTEAGGGARPPRPASAMEARRTEAGGGARPPRPVSAMEARRDKVERPSGPERSTSARRSEGRKAGGGWEGIEEDEGIFDDDGDDCDDFELGAIKEEGGETREQSALLVDDEETDGLPGMLQRRVAASESQRPATTRAHGDIVQESISEQTRQRPKRAKQEHGVSEGILVETFRHRPQSAMAERSREDDTESRARPFSAMARLAAHAAPGARPVSARTDAQGEAEYTVVGNTQRRPRSAAAGRMVRKDVSLDGVPPAWEKRVSAESIKSNAESSREMAENGSHGKGTFRGLNEEVEKIMRGDGIYMTARDMLVAVSEGRPVFDVDDSLSRRPSSAMGVRLPSTFQRRPSSEMLRRRSSVAASLEQKHLVVDETAGMGRLQGMLRQLELDHAAKTQLPQTDIYVKVVRASHLSILEGYRSADPLIQVKLCDTGGRGIVEVKKTPFKRQTTDPWFSTSIILNGRRLDEDSYLEISALHLSPVGTMRPTWGSLKIPIRDLSTGVLVAKWYTLTGGDHVAKGSTHEKPMVYLEMISGNEAERSAVLALNAHALMNPPVRKRREDKGKKASSSGNATADNSRSSKGTGQARTVLKAAGGTGVSAARRMTQLLVAEPPPPPFPPPDMWEGIGVPGGLFAAFALSAAKEGSESSGDIEGVSLGGVGADVKELAALIVPDAVTLDLSHIPLASDDLLRYLKQIRTVSGGKGGLHNLVLRGCTKLHAQDVGAFAAHFRDLRCIDLSSCDQVDDKFLARVASSAPGLERVSVARCERVTSAGIAALASGCPQMRYFDCQGCVCIDGHAVKLVASGFPMIKSLDLRGLRLVKGPDLAALRQCTRLKQLSIAGMRHPSESQLSLVCSGSGLERLDLGMCDGVGDVLAACLGKSKSLTDLSLHSARILTDAGLTALASGHPPLKAIRIPRCSRISDLGLTKLASCCPSLQIVVLDNCPMVTDAGVSCLVDFCAQSLASLSLRGLKSITASCILAAIRECFRLESLDLTGTECEGDARIEEARRAREPPAQIGRNPTLSAEVTLVVKRLSKELALSREAPCNLQIISGDPGVKGDVIGFRAARDLPHDIYMHVMKEGES